MSGQRLSPVRIKGRDRCLEDQHIALKILQTPESKQESVMLSCVSMQNIPVPSMIYN